MSEWFDNLTLGEIKEHYWDNLESVLKKSRTVQLKDREDCQKFYLQTIREIANNHGAKIPENDPKAIHNQCVVHGIQIERRIERDKYRCLECGEIQERQPLNQIPICFFCAKPYTLQLVEEADHRNDGTFIMKRNEIVGFISEPGLVVDRKTANGLVLINDGREPQFMMRVLRKA